MADSIISFLVDNLTQLLKQEAKLLLGVEDEVRSLHAELQLMNAFLRGFEMKGDDQDTANVLVSQLRAVAHEAEDVIDIYVSNMAQQRGENFFGKFKHMFVELTTRHEVGKKIEDLTKRIKKIYEDRENLGIQLVQAGESSKKQPKLAIAEKGEVVGLDAETETIRGHLTNGKPGLHVVPIVGMGGLGKTTLARKVYNDPIVHNLFNFLVWVDVSKEYKEREMLLAILKCFVAITDDVEKMDIDDLKKRILQYLRSTKYLIVLDDVWDIKCWDELKEIVESNLQGSRIILTTRNQDVALSIHPRSTPIFLRLLDKVESWKLLSMKVFRGGNCPPNLEDVGKKIAEKCRGLPLAIVVMAGVLERKDNRDSGVLARKDNRDSRWPKVLETMSSILTEDATECMDILALSYDDLPYRLKWCFLYFGIFPEDFKIPTRQLIRLWIAEGFVKQKEWELVEDSAEEYLEQLIDRNLIQPVKLRSDGGVKVCQIHDLLRDLCILKAKKENFLEVRRNINRSSPFNSRRLAIHGNTLQCISSNSSISNVRSFLCFGGLDEGQLASMHWKLLYKGFTLLRVLDLWDVVVDCIPDQVEKLIHLRYLRLRSHSARNLPSSIWNLWNLQTFEVKAPSVDCPQIGIWKMQQLRHLYFHGKAAVLLKPRGHGDDLTNLQSLSRINPGSCTKNILSKLPKLVKLGIYGDLSEHMDQYVFDGISVLKQLQTLKLERDRRFQNLSSLDCVEIPANITKLTLSETQLSRDPMQKLGKLPKLQVLKLTNDAYVGVELHCSSGGFPQLKVLKLINLGINKWVMSTGSMASLQNVVISRCGNLEGLPSALKNMSTLWELELWWPNASVLSSSKNVQKHIANDKFKLTIYNSETL